MKTKLFLGILASLMIFVQAQANPARGAKVETYNRERARILGEGRTTAQGLASEALNIANTRILSELNVPEATKGQIREALTERPARGNSAAVTKQMVEARLERLVDFAASKKVAEEMLRSTEATERAEGQSILDAVGALSKTIANAQFTRYRAAREKIEGEKLTEAEMKDAADALTHLETISTSVIRMSKADRDMYTKVENKRDELLQTGRFTGEEALVLAIMAVKPCSKAKALEIIRRLKNCAV